MAKPLPDADWVSIKQAYIQGCSLNEVAQMFGVNRSTIANHARTGKWQEAREKYGAKHKQIVRRRPGTNTTLQLLFNSGSADVQDPVAVITEQCLRIVRVGLDRIEVGMSQVAPNDSNTIRSLCSSLKDLQTVAGAFAGMTRAEIAARIEQIQRARQADEEGGTGVVMIPAVQELEEVSEDG